MPRANSFSGKDKDNFQSKHLLMEKRFTKLIEDFTPLRKIDTFYLMRAPRQYQLMKKQK